MDHKAEKSTKDWPCYSLSEKPTAIKRVSFQAASWKALTYPARCQPQFTAKAFYSLSYVTLSCEKKSLILKMLYDRFVRVTLKEPVMISITSLINDAM